VLEAEGAYIFYNWVLVPGLLEKQIQVVILSFAILPGQEVQKHSF